MEEEFIKPGIPGLIQAVSVFAEKLYYVEKIV